MNCKICNATLVNIELCSDNYETWVCVNKNCIEYCQVQIHSRKRAQRACGIAQSAMKNMEITMYGVNIVITTRMGTLRSTIQIDITSETLGCIIYRIIEMRHR